MPYGDFNCLQLPEDIKEKEIDYVMLADIFPTGYHVTELTGVKPGDSVVIYGAGPVCGKNAGKNPCRHDDLNIFSRDEVGQTLPVFPIHT